MRGSCEVQMIYLCSMWWVSHLQQRLISLLGALSITPEIEQIVSVRLHTSSALTERLGEGKVNGVTPRAAWL